MLEKIIESRFESAILSFLLVAPERSFTAQEISKRLGVPSGKAVYILTVFAKQGMVSAFGKRGKKYFIINPRYKLLPEIKQYLLKNGSVYHDELFGAIKKLGDVRAAFLSGIFTGYPNLPVDLLLVGKINLQKLSDFLKRAERLMGQEINYSIMTEDEFHMRRDTFDRFIKDIFDYRHLVVVDNLNKPLKE
jgi:hypothetical protein